MDLIVATLCLGIVIAGCLYGLFSRFYQDNLPQCLGMVVIGIWCVSALDRVLDRGWVRAESLMLYIGLALFAIGTAIKVYRHRHRCGETS